LGESHNFLVHRQKLITIVTLLRNYRLKVISDAAA
jgi:hypothetical protein